MNFETKTLNSLPQFNCEPTHVSTLHGVSTRYLLEMFPIETLAESRINLWMQQSIYDMVAFLDATINL